LEIGDWSKSCAPLTGHALSNQSRQRIRLQNDDATIPPHTDIGFRQAGPDGVGGAGKATFGDLVEDKAKVRVGQVVAQKEDRVTASKSV
jgi:hypothetical protein